MSFLSEIKERLKPDPRSLPPLKLKPPWSCLLCWYEYSCQWHITSCIFQLLIKDFTPICIILQGLLVLLQLYTRLIHVILSLILLPYTFHYTNVMMCFFIHSPINGHLYCFQCFTITKTPEWTFLYHFLGTCAKISLENVREIVSLVFYLISHLPIVLPCGYAHLITPRGRSSYVSYLTHTELCWTF